MHLMSMSHHLLCQLAMRELVSSDWQHPILPGGACLNCYSLTLEPSSPTADAHCMLLVSEYVRPIAHV